MSKCERIASECGVVRSDRPKVRATSSAGPEGGGPRLPECQGADHSRYPRCLGARPSTTVARRAQRNAELTSCRLNMGDRVSPPRLISWCGFDGSPAFAAVDVLPMIVYYGAAWGTARPFKTFNTPILAFTLSNGGVRRLDTGARTGLRGCRQASYARAGSSRSIGDPQHNNREALP